MSKIDHLFLEFYKYTIHFLDLISRSSESSCLFAEKVVQTPYCLPPILLYIFLEERKADILSYPHMLFRSFPTFSSSCIICVAQSILAALVSSQPSSHHLWRLHRAVRRAILRLQLSWKVRRWHVTASHNRSLIFYSETWYQSCLNAIRKHSIMKIMDEISLFMMSEKTQRTS